MEKEVITLKSGKVNEYLHHIDLEAYGSKRILSVFVGEFENESVLIDCGSSLNVRNLLRYLKRNKIALSSFKYLIPSHHHFDHNGGMWKIYEELKKYNPNIKILTNNLTKILLNDYNNHLNRGKSTYGDYIGEMKPIEESAFEIINPSVNFSSDPNKLEIIDKFSVNGKEIKLSILKTPGHTPDHQTPLFSDQNSINFIFLGEAAGTLYHNTKLLTMPTSMPIYYNHEDYMNSIKNLRQIQPSMAGFGHFGIVNGKYNVQDTLSEHESFMEKFKNLVIKYYSENPKTKYVLDKVLPELLPRTDFSIDGHPIFAGIVLAVVYGMMISLGYRSIPKEEMKYIN
ncbi:MAG: MBL fold metallo-hydrolase [Candidatus Hermodarchaeota archaeon]